MRFGLLLFPGPSDSAMRQPERLSSTIARGNRRSEQEAWPQATPVSSGGRATLKWTSGTRAGAPGRRLVAPLHHHSSRPSYVSFLHRMCGQHVVAGSIAGVTEHSFMFPIDTMKTIMQVRQSRAAIRFIRASTQVEGKDGLSKLSAKSRGSFRVHLQGWLLAWCGRWPLNL